jgi:hypothetical protein
MAEDDESDDLYDEEFDFVDEEDDLDDEESDIVEEVEVDEAEVDEVVGNRRADELDADRDEEPVDEYGRPQPKSDYVVHVYEHKKFKRTIERPFTAEDAEAFATEYNRTSKSYGRFAVTGKNDSKPKKTLE